MHALPHDEIGRSCFIFDRKKNGAVQWAGLRGLLSSLVDYRTARIHPLRKRYGLQYNYTFDNHAVDTEKELDPVLRTRWLSQLPQAVITRMPFVTTRGEFLLAAHRAFLEIHKPKHFQLSKHNEKFPGLFSSTRWSLLLARNYDVVVVAIAHPPVYQRSDYTPL